MKLKINSDKINIDIKKACDDSNKTNDIWKYIIV